MKKIGAVILGVIAVTPFKLAALGYTTLIRNTALVYPPVSGNNIMFNIAISPLLTLQVTGIFQVNPGSPATYELQNPSYTVLQGRTTMDEATPGYFAMNDPYWNILYQLVAKYVESLKQV